MAWQLYRYVTESERAMMLSSDVIDPWKRISDDHDYDGTGGTYLLKKGGKAIFVATIIGFSKAKITNIETGKTRTFNDGDEFALGQFLRGVSR